MAEDKRLSVDLMSMRRDLWTHGDVELDALHPTKFGDKVRWIDTSVMAVDCLTKVMPPDFLIAIQKTNVYDITPDPGSTAKKIKNRPPEQRPLETSPNLRGHVRDNVLGV